MSKSKDPSSKLHEKHQTILADLLRDEDNKYCADCMAKGKILIVATHKPLVSLVRTFKRLTLVMSNPANSVIISAHVYLCS